MIQGSLADCEVAGYSQQVLLEAVRNNVDAAKTILMCANHQKRIVNDVLSFSKLEYMMLSVTPHPVQPAALVDRTCRMFESDLQAHKINLSIVAEPSLDANNIDWIMCDPSRIAQIFINLLTNAIKFTRSEPRREITIRYGVSLSDPRHSFTDHDIIEWAPSTKIVNNVMDGLGWGDGQTLYFSLSVTDTGVGMRSEDIKKLFHRFTQANSKTSIKYGGSGMGLFISQKLCEKQGGEIGVSSGASRGSTFAFYVMARRANHENGTGMLRPTPTRYHSELNALPIKVDTQNMHVLLVEDNIVNQKVLSKQLKTAGCTVHIANHGVEALEFLRKSTLWQGQKSGPHLDIILMDWEMPVMDGLTCSREIRALHNAGQVTRHIEIIAITANAREEQIQSALDSGIVSLRLE
jgi:CheY-like chemotaxis protein